MSSCEDNDLFGDGHDGDSLFGGDDDAHLFDGPEDDGEDRATPPGTSTPGVAAVPSTGFLSFPSVPDPHDALSRCHAGLTSGQHTVSTQDPSGNAWGLSVPEVTNSETAVDAQVFRDQAIDSLPFASHNHGDQASHEQQGQALHQPSPEPSPSKAGLIEDVEAMFEEEFTQDQPGQEQAFDAQPSSATALPHVQLADDVEMLTEYIVLRDQASRATTTSLGNPPANIGMGPATTEHRFADAKCRQGVRLPRRIDFEGADVSILKHYVTLKRNFTLPEHYERLELPQKAGKVLQRDLKDYVKLKPDMQHLRQKGRLDIDVRRVNFLSAALRILKDECWGPNWFGPSSPTGGTRKLLWPADSTTLLLRFTNFLYKAADQVRYNEDQKLYRRELGKTKNALQRRTTSRQPMTEAVIDLTDDGDNISGAMRSVTPNTSVCSSRPSSSHMSVSQASLSGTFFSDQNSVDASSRPSLAPSLAPSLTPSLTLPPYRSPAFHDAPELFIFEDSTPGSQALDGEADQTPSGEENPEPIGITLDMLAEQVAELKQRKQKPPAAESVIYRFTFTDAGDDQDLRPPLVGVLADNVIKGDKAVRTIQSAFSRAGVPATIHVNGGQRPFKVKTQDEWNEAVHAVWQQYGDGAVVEVGIHV
ncbi:hypothetical protein GE09DRAFT_1218112 [Coniochaeta sp. 2T2.1]|nr:hypothetical protein GE09DRAFT_1218112 [Coniochaeta sp. 2T2.1]